MCAYLCVCACVCAHTRVRVCVHACLCACLWVKLRYMCFTYPKTIASDTYNNQLFIWGCHSVRRTKEERIHKPHNGEKQNIIKEKRGLPAGGRVGLAMTFMLFRRLEQNCTYVSPGKRPLTPFVILRPFSQPCKQQAFVTTTLASWAFKRQSLTARVSKERNSARVCSSAVTHRLNNTFTSNRIRQIKKWLTRFLIKLHGTVVLIWSSWSAGPQKQ